MEFVCMSCEVLFGLGVVMQCYLGTASTQDTGCRTACSAHAITLHGVLGFLLQ